LELLLLALLGIQLARLFWAAVSPLGPIGTPPESLAEAGTVPSNSAIFRAFDPFFQPLVASGPLVVYDLDLDLYGTRVDRVSGRGSAIVAVHGGPQQSFNVGEEIMPGVTLQAVAFDSVTIDRGGTREQLFIDQSVPARTVSPEPAGEQGEGEQYAEQTGEPVFFGALVSELSMTPKMENGRLEGVVLNPAGNGELFKKIGLMPNDVLLSVNRMRIDTAARAGDIGAMLPKQGVAVFEIRRGGQVKTISFEFTK
jgi:general secretion pathway protein C